MALEFGTTELAAQPILGIRTSTTMDEIGNVMGLTIASVRRKTRKLLILQGVTVYF